MPDFAVSPEKNRWLKERMEALGLREGDIIEKFIRSSGRGGQKVNKSSSCVYLKHLPTGIEVKCMKDRSQSINRFLARRELVRRIEELMGIEGSEVIRIRKRKAKAKKRAIKKYKNEGEAPSREISYGQGSTYSASPILKDIRNKRGPSKRG